MHLFKSKRERDADRALRKEAESPQPGLWWLSFADPDLPAGTQFLGVCIVEADGPVSAVAQASLLGINPGGEVGIAGPAPLDVWGPEYRNRLLDRAEAETL